MRDYSKFIGKGNPNYKTGYCNSPIHNSWCNMKGRCLNKNHPKYHRYGGRGITVCAEWMDFKNFLEWSLNNGYKKGLSIDRIDNDGNYCPENCQWITHEENSRKKVTTKISSAQASEIRKRINENWYDLAKEYGCSHGNIWFIMHNFTHVANGECSKKLREYKTAF